MTVTVIPKKISEVAPNAGVTCEAIRKWVRSGKVRAVWDSKEKLYRVDETEVMAVAELTKRSVPNPLVIPSEPQSQVAE
jgi:predicted site-specific integrase-resolvase